MAGLSCPVQIISTYALFPIVSVTGRTFGDVLDFSENV